MISVLLHARRVAKEEQETKVQRERSIRSSGGSDKRARARAPDIPTVDSAVSRDRTRGIRLTRHTERDRLRSRVPIPFGIFREGRVIRCEPRQERDPRGIARHDCSRPGLPHARSRMHIAGPTRSHVRYLNVINATIYILRTISSSRPLRSERRTRGISLPCFVPLLLSLPPPLSLSHAFSTTQSFSVLCPPKRGKIGNMYVCVCVCVCVREREREHALALRPEGSLLLATVCSRSTIADVESPSR